MEGTGRQSFEVEIVGDAVHNLCVGVVTADIGMGERKGKDFGKSEETRACLMEIVDGTLFGNGKYDDDQAGSLAKGDRLRVVVDCDDGSVSFLKNGVAHGPGYGAGTLAKGVAVVSLTMDLRIPPFRSGRARHASTSGAPPRRSLPRPLPVAVGLPRISSLALRTPPSTRGSSPWSQREGFRWQGSRSSAWFVCLGDRRVLPFLFLQASFRAP